MEFINKAIELWHKEFKDNKDFISNYFEVFQAKDNLHCLSLEGDIVSMLMACQYKWFYKGFLMNFAYLSGIVTNENYRKKGYCKQLMTSILNKLYSKNVSLCGLIAANEHLVDYYNKLNFTNACQKEEGIFNRRDIDKRLVDEYFLIQNIDLDNQAIKHFVSFLDNSVSHDKQTLSLYNGVEYMRLAISYQGTIRAFAIGVKDKDFVKLVHLAFCNNQAKQAMLSLCAYTYKRDVKYKCNSYLAKEDKLQMLRVIDVRKCLNLYAVTHPQEDFTMNIKDDIIPQNNITIHLREAEVVSIKNSYKVPSFSIEQVTKKIFDKGYMFLMLDE